MKKTTTVCIWATDTQYILLRWVGGEFYNVCCWRDQRCGEDTLEGMPEYLSKSQIRDCLRYNRAITPASEWLGYALNEGVNPEEARTLLIEGGVL